MLGNGASQSLELLLVEIVPGLVWIGLHLLQRKLPQPPIRLRLLGIVAEQGAKAPA